MNKSTLEKKLYCILTRICPAWNIKLRYLAIYKKRLPMETPKTFVEKLLWLRIKSYNESRFVCRCADKVEVRSYVEEKGFGELLNEVYGIYDNVDEIDWDTLPDQFAMKWNFGATFNIICEDRKSMDASSVMEKMRKWGEVDYYLPFAEMQYRYCKKRILVEKYLDTKQGFLPYDYKLYCFNGKCKAILFIMDREDESTKKGGFFSTDWSYIGKAGERYNDFEEMPKRPRSLEKMIECAEKLSEGIPFVRMDFYECGGKAIFGEMTFTPTAGFSPAQIEIDGQDMGDLIDVSLISNIE